MNSKAEVYITMRGWLKRYYLVVVFPFIETLDKARKRYYPDEKYIIKYAVSNPVISVKPILSKKFRVSNKVIYGLGIPCEYLCGEGYRRCKECKRIQKKS